jgi:hypothetical protein
MTPRPPRRHTAQVRTATVLRPKSRRRRAKLLYRNRPIALSSAPGSNSIYASKRLRPWSLRESAPTTPSKRLSVWRETWGSKHFWLRMHASLLVVATLTVACAPRMKSIPCRSPTFTTSTVPCLIRRTCWLAFSKVIVFAIDVVLKATAGSCRSHTNRERGRDTPALGGPLARAIAGSHHFRSITTSRYSLGSTSVRSSERLRVSMRASKSPVKAACFSASSAPKVLFIGP